MNEKRKKSFCSSSPGLRARGDNCTGMSIRNREEENKYQRMERKGKRKRPHKPPTHEKKEKNRKKDFPPTPRVTGNTGVGRRKYFSSHVCTRA